jgi:hypothetical protein
VLASELNVISKLYSLCEGVFVISKVRQLFSVAVSSEDLGVQCC